MDIKLDKKFVGQTIQNARRRLDTIRMVRNMAISLGVSHGIYDLISWFSFLITIFVLDYN